MITLQELKDFCSRKDMVIVGNSNCLLKNKNMGDFINSHSVVLRMNFGVPTKEYEQFVGTKTHLWAMALKSKEKQLEYKRLFNPKYILWLTKDKSFISPEVTENLYKANDNFYIELQERLGWERPSTGCQVVYFCHTQLQPKSINIVGFDFFKSPDFFEKDINFAVHNNKITKKLIIKLPAPRI